MTSGLSNNKNIYLVIFTLSFMDGYISAMDDATIGYYIYYYIVDVVPL